MSDPKVPVGGSSQLPAGGIQVGNRVMYPDLLGNLHPVPGQAINSNQRVEGDLSRGSSGGCNQEASKVPYEVNGN